MPLPEVFDRMALRREHIALAVDPAGLITGVITMEDLLETLLGREIFDELDNPRRARETA
jgi:CBS domain containing-hemolysin-like protein